MTDITISVDDLTTALKAATSQSLPWVELRPAATPTNEPTQPDDPETVPAVPTVMLTFELVPNSAYRFTYGSSRYVRLHYVLERDGDYEVGVFHIVHNLPSLTFTPTDEGSQPVEPPPFSPPTFTVDREVSLQTSGTLNVDLGADHDPLSSGELPQFGLTFKITNATPSVFPKLSATFGSVIPMEDI